jgi:cold shock CspA family protein
MDTTINKGRLKSWNEDKGFGFIEAENSKKDIFIHISALKGMSRRPVAGDVIHFQIHIDNNGKQRAVNASIEGVKKIKLVSPRKNIKGQKKNQSNKWTTGIFISAILIFSGFYFYEQSIDAKPSSSFSKHVEQNKPKNYSCRGKVYCSEMTSCGEAKFYINNCPATKMDGDRDGIPCESQWCSY